MIVAAQFVAACVGDEWMRSYEPWGDDLCPVTPRTRQIGRQAYGSSAEALDPMADRPEPAGLRVRLDEGA